MKTPAAVFVEAFHLIHGLLRLGLQIDGDDLGGIQSVKLRVHLS